jgi:hypothetical protein
MNTNKIAKLFTFVSEFAPLRYNSQLRFSQQVLLLEILQVTHNFLRSTQPKAPLLRSVGFLCLLLSASFLSLSLSNVSVRPRSRAGYFNLSVSQTGI